MQRDAHRKTAAQLPAPLLRDLEQRLTRLEAEYKHMITHQYMSDLQARMATKKDTDKLQAENKDIRANMATKEDTDRLQAEIKDIRAEMATKENIRQLQAEIKKIWAEIKGIKAEIKDIQAEIKDMRAEMATKEDIRQLQAEIKDIRTGMGKLHEAIHRSETRLLYWILGTGVTLAVVILGAIFAVL